ncbi:MAG: quinone oxidoreductase [Alphaproteobacteria bacterium HGW-Alphaproteobacteria-2]|nr:MAG: quinone oxidoreductase [Alphaproteobacteria bacterium HGW-Alphaproteobacteria-2]
MAMAAVIHEKGAPEVFRWEEVAVGNPGPGAVRIVNDAIGVNYVDTYHRRGMAHPWPVPPLPVVLGFEGVGRISAVGPGVTGFREGDRVCYALPPHGAYAEERLYPVDQLLHAPPGIDDRTIAAMMLKGLTAQYLLRRTYRVQPGDTILVHAAAGGMGLILCQWGAALGATVIGTVSTPEKAEIARAHGCHHPVVRGEARFSEVVAEVTAGEGCAVVYESIGKDTFAESLDCLRPMGVCASYGHASGPPPLVDIIADLGAKGSLFVTRPAIMHYMAKRADLEASAAELFDAVGSGRVRIAVNHVWPLSQAADAHRAIEEGRTTGSTVLLPRG